MPIIRHIAGLPTETEQRCVRCCEVIWTLDKDGRMCFFPAQNMLSKAPINMRSEAIDCTPHDPHAIDDLREVLGEALAELERAR